MLFLHLQKMLKNHNENRHCGNLPELLTLPYKDNGPLGVKSIPQMSHKNRLKATSYNSLMATSCFKITFPPCSNLTRNINLTNYGQNKVQK
jgi:hypothetical protein